MLFCCALFWVFVLCVLYVLYQTEASPRFVKDACDRPCPMNLDIVSDQHGKRYSNECIFEVAKCRDPSLVLSRNLPASPG